MCRWQQFQSSSEAVAIRPAFIQRPRAADFTTMGCQMDFKNRLLCYQLRNPARKGIKKTPLSDIVKKKLVRKTDGKVPSESAISQAAAAFVKEKGQLGRPQGSRKTTKAEDATILKKFKKLRPPGAYVDSRIIHDNLGTKLRKTICRRTVLNRLAEKGYRTEDKLSKSDLGPRRCKQRVVFSGPLKDRTPEQWKLKLQACGDIKIFTYYPKELRAKFRRLRCRRTIMSKAEKKLPAFQRPKRWFPKEEWKLTKSQKIFGLTTSGGHKLAFCLPSPFNESVWIELVKTKVAPFLRSVFPNRRNIESLLDGEKAF